MAFAFRIANGADKKQWEAYCKTPPAGIIKIPSYEMPKHEKPKKLTMEQAKQLKKQLKGN